jgi:phosphoribosylglycinamide formyltransferase-1
MKRIAVLASGGGTNLQALIDAQESGVIKSGRIVSVVTNNPKAYALERAKKAGIGTKVITKKECGGDNIVFNKAICDYLKSESVDVVALAGFFADNCR